MIKYVTIPDVGKPEVAVEQALKHTLLHLQEYRASIKNI